MRRWLAPLLVFVLGCDEEEPPLEVRDKEVCLTRADGVAYCIETYEASRRDATAGAEGAKEEPPRSLELRRPWVAIKWEAARAQCEAKGKRLCERDEWIDACDGLAGAGGSTFTYGDTLDASRCNTEGAEVEASGGRAGCRSPDGVFDLSGNVWEWTGNTPAAAAARGGGYRSSMVHRCASGDGTLVFPPNEASVEVGFRCCRLQ